MSIKRQTYLDLSESARANSGAAAISDLRRMLAFPLLPEQRTEIEARIQKVQSWIDGSLTIETHPVDDGRSCPPVTHEIVVAESVKLTEDISR